MCCNKPKFGSVYMEIVEQVGSQGGTHATSVDSDFCLCSVIYIIIAMVTSLFP